MALRQAAQSDMARALFGAAPVGRLALLRCAWARAVGPELAGRTEVLALEGDALRVRVPDARWRKVLHRMQPDLLSRLRRIAGGLAPRRLGFQEGPVALPEPVAPPAVLVPAASAPLPPRVAAETAAISDAGLRRDFEATAARYLARFSRPGDSGAQ